MPDQQALSALLDGLEHAGEEGADWYMALVLVGLDQTDNDLSAAVAGADAAFRREEPEEPDIDEEDEEEPEDDNLGEIDLGDLDIGDISYAREHWLDPLRYWSADPSWQDPTGKGRRKWVEAGQRPRYQGIEPGTRSKGNAAAPAGAAAPSSAPKAGTATRGKALSPEAVQSLAREIQSINPATLDDAGMQALAGRLLAMTAADMQSLGTALGVKAKGAKSAMAKQITAWAKEQVGEDNTIDLDQTPRLLDEAPPKPTPQPKPPEPGFTGIDSLGRHWQNGKLVPGKVEPPKPRESAGFDENRRLRLADFGPLQILSKEQLADLDKLQLRRNMRPSLVKGYSPEYDQAAVDRLQKAGLIATTLTPNMFQVTDAGAASIAFSVHGLAATQGDPSTEKEIQGMRELLLRLSDDGRKKLLDHLGIKDVKYEGVRPEAISAMEATLRKRAIQHHNPIPISQRLRDAEELHATVAAISNVETGDDRREELQKEEDGLRRQLKDIGVTSGLSMLDANIERYEKFSRPGAKLPRGITKARVKADLEVLRRVKASREEIIQERKKTYSEAPHHEVVANALREHVKNAHRFECHFRESGESGGRNLVPVSDEAKQGVARAMDLLKGAVESGDIQLGSIPVVRVDGDNRAHRNDKTGHVNVGSYTDVGTFIHELMHGVEGTSDAVRASTAEFRAHRLGDEKPMDLKKFGMPGEFGAKDQFDRAFEGSSAYYVGKEYGDGDTEILSMGAEKLFNDPAGFCKKDPEYAAFIIGVLTGKLRNNPLPKE